MRVLRLRRKSPLALCAVALSGAMVLAACGTSAKDSSAPALPGVTATTVDVGFSIVDIGEVAKALGFIQPDYGGYEKQSKAIQAIIDHINKNGGMGGRQAKASIKKYEGATDSPVQSEAQCKSFTQDEGVMAAVLDGGFQNNTVPCFVKANTVLLLQSLLAIDQTQFEKNAPYLWSPSHPEYSAFVKAQLAAMNEAKYFEGNSGVLLMPNDDEVSRRTTESIIEPYLEEIGITKIQSSYVDSTNTGTLGASSAAALVTGKNNKLNRVIVIGGARIQPVALSDQTAVGYDSTWAVSTYDNPIFTQNNPDSIVTDLRLGMTGIGYAPAQDVSDQYGPPFPDPNNPAQKQCVDIVTAAGATPPENSRTNWKMALLYCDAAFFLKATLDQLPNKETVTGKEFQEAAGKIGSTYKSALAFASQWGPGVFAGTNAAKKLAWDEKCLCFDYSGELITFSTTGAGGPVPTQSVGTGGAVGATPTPSVGTGSTTPGSAAPGTPAPSVGSDDIPLATITVPAP